MSLTHVLPAHHSKRTKKKTKATAEAAARARDDFDQKEAAQSAQLLATQAQLDAVKQSMARTLGFLHDRVVASTLPHQQVPHGQDA